MREKEIENRKGGEREREIKTESSENDRKIERN
jgi:hypothetical protein